MDTVEKDTYRWIIKEPQHSFQESDSLFHFIFFSFWGFKGLKGGKGSLYGKF